MSDRSCVDCGADIGHRGVKSTRCEEHAAIHRRAYKNAHQKIWSQTPQGKAYIKAYEQTSERKATHKAYKQTPLYKTARKEYEQTSERKAAERERQRQRRQTSQGKEYNYAYQRERNQRLGGQGYRRAWPDLLLRDGSVCGICGGPLDPIREEFHVDHIRPAAHGGTNDLSNLQLAHPLCNISKHDKWDEELT